jgi:glyoxylase-like metal-dependent hydrolase (beta-lactamase superfamily II)
MTAQTRRVKIGAFECLVVLDCLSPYPNPAQSFFSGGTPEEVGSFLQSQGVDPSTWKVYESPYPVMVIFTGDRTVLIDTGAGDFNVEHGGEPGRLLKNLAREGIRPAQIDTVILTHGHPDHVGGFMAADNRPQFPKARYLIDRKEWDYWASDECEKSSPGLVEYARRYLTPLREVVELTDGEAEVAPGVRILPAYGHTPGHICVELLSEGRKLVYLSDLVLISYHLQKPQWCYKSEVDKPLAIATRRTMLGRLAAEHALVQAFHLPFPGLGYVVPDGTAWRWQPLE